MYIKCYTSIYLSRLYLSFVIFIIRYIYRLLYLSVVVLIIFYIYPFYIEVSTVLKECLSSTLPSVYMYVRPNRIISLFGLVLCVQPVF